ncbi:MAG: DinB family protein [Syntrophobacteraceae bacterium]
MKSRSKELSERLRSFNDEVISFVRNCDEAAWQKMCVPEQWPVGVTARHIGAGHYQAVGMAQTILKGQKFPELTMSEIDEMANRHAREHADCTKSEVLEILGKEGPAMAAFVAGLDDSQLDKAGYLPAMKTEVTVGQLIQFVVLESGVQHFQSMKKAATDVV